jgi:hypothetical protein
MAYATITVTVDSKRAEETINLIHKRLRSDINKGLVKSTRKAGEKYLENFESEGHKYKAWDPLAESTIRSRESLGFAGTSPILERSGHLKSVAIESMLKINGPYHVSKTDNYRGLPVEVAAEFKSTGDKGWITFHGRGWKFVHNDGSKDSPKRPFWYSDRTVAFAAADGLLDWVSKDVLRF